MKLTMRWISEGSWGCSPGLRVHVLGGHGWGCMGIPGTQWTVGGGVSIPHLYPGVWWRGGG